MGTYTTAGASLGFATLWTALLTFPLMAAVQLVYTKIGLVTGRGLAAGVLLLSSRAVDRDCRARHRTIGDQDRPGASLWGRLGSLAGGRPLVIDDYT
jgi:Natural resistance-associated macrophage protein